jgi:hypothetical protein
MPFFRKKKEIDRDFYQFALDLAAWTIANFDGIEQLRCTPLVTPESEFFPSSQSTGHERASEIFNLVKRHADMADWDCDLRPVAQTAPHYLGDSVLQKFEANAPAGTFAEEIEGDKTRSVITYSSTLLNQPYELVATFAHELAHLLMTTAEDFPFDPEMEEPVTDGLAIMMGFGIFIANGSSGFRTDSQGWESHRSGYLCEGEILHVLAAFVLLSGTDPAPANKYLKPHMAKRFKRILATVENSPDLRGLLPE